jgi:hypothetical protein
MSSDTAVPAAENKAAPAVHEAFTTFIWGGEMNRYTPNGFISRHNYQRGFGLARSRIGPYKNFRDRLHVESLAMSELRSNIFLKLSWQRVCRNGHILRLTLATSALRSR